MSEEFATALIRFTADDSQVEAVARRAEARVRTAAKNMDQAMREQFRRAAGEGGSFAPQVAGGRTEKQHVAELEAKIEKIRALRSKAASAGEDASGGFSEGFKRGLSGADKPLADIGAKIGGVARLFTSPTALIVASAAAIGSAVVASAAKAVEFDKAFRDLAVFVDPAVVSVENMRARVLALDPALGGATERLQALRGAFLDTGNLEDAFRIEGVSAKLHKLTGLAREAGANIIGSLADAFRDQGTSFEHIGDVLFEVQKRGGGSIEELGSGFLVLADSAATLNLSIDDLGAALVTLGERAGANPQKNIAALALLLRTLTLNTDEFKRRGFDVKDIVKTEGFTGLIRVMKDATQGSEEQLKELGISGRNVTAILKILSDEGVATFARALDNLEKSTPSSVNRALETRAKFVSDTLERGAKILESAQLSFGERVLGMVRGRAQGTAGQQLVGITKLIKDAEAEMAPFLARQKEMGESFGLANSDKQNLGMLQARKAELENVAAGLQRVIGEQDKGADSVDKVTVAVKKGADASTAWQRAQEAMNDTLRQLDADRVVRAAEDVAKASERTVALTEATGAAEIAAMEARRQLDAVRAQSEGREVRGLEDLLAVKKRVLEETTAATLKSISDQGAASQRGLEAERDRIAGALKARQARSFSATDPQTQSEIATLTSQLEAAEAKVGESRADSLHKSKLAEIKASQDMVQHEARASQERQSLVERELQQRDRIEEKSFQLRKSLGAETATSEIAHLARLTEAHKGSAEQRLDAEKNLADKIKALRDASAAAGEGLLQRAASRLQGRGIKSASLGELEQEVARGQIEAKQGLDTLASGGSVALSSDAKRMGLSDFFQESRGVRGLNELGVTSGGATGMAVSEASAAFAGGLGGGAMALQEFTGAVRQATAGVRGGGPGAAGGGGVTPSSIGSRGGSLLSEYGQGIARGNIVRGRRGDEAFSESGVFLGAAGAIAASNDASELARGARYDATQSQAFFDVRDTSRSMTPPGMFGTDSEGGGSGGGSGSDLQLGPLYSNLSGSVTRTSGAFESASEAVRAFAQAALDASRGMPRGGRGGGDVLESSRPGGWSPSDSSAAGRNLFLESKRGAQTIESDV